MVTIIHTFIGVLDFLQANPSETVLMRLKHEKSDLGDDRLNQEFKKYVDRYNDIIWKNNSGTSNPTLG